jgi:DsbC/DsbD-like thiol-disulfide interchange protein
MSGSTHGGSAHGSAQGVQIAARLDAAASPNLSPMRVALDISIDPGLHVYGLPVPEGFIPLSVDVVASPEGVSAGTPTFPPPTPHQMEGFDEPFFIYEGDVSVSIPLTVNAKGDDVALEVKVRYQACGERGCFMPQTVALNLPVRA